MTRIAVTDHAVTRYKQRVPGAQALQDESVREIIREKIEEGFLKNLIQYHPTVQDRRILPFTAGKEMLYLSFGKNTTQFPGDVAVIGVLYETDLGKTQLGVKLGDVAPELAKIELYNVEPPKFIVRIGEGTIEQYDAKGEKEVQELLKRRVPNLLDVRIYQLVLQEEVYEQLAR